jgi:hypothetical protein
LSSPRSARTCARYSNASPPKIESPSNSSLQTETPRARQDSRTTGLTYATFKPLSQTHVHCFSSSHVHLNALFSSPRPCTSLLNALDDLYVDDGHGRTLRFFVRHDYQSQSATTTSPLSLVSLGLRLRLSFSPSLCPCSSTEWYSALLQPLFTFIMLITFNNRTYTFV